MVIKNLVDKNIFLQNENISVQVQFLNFLHIFKPFKKHKQLLTKNV